MRAAFSKALVFAAQADPRVLLLTGDHGYALFDEFRRACPDQYINAGVAEQNMVGVAAGLAKGGFRPVVYGLSSFVPVRVLEQIKLDVWYERLAVVFIGDGAGVVYSGLGSSHQSMEDVAAVRALPHISILSPADDLEMAGCVALALRHDGPVYIRMGKADLGRVHEVQPEVDWGKLCPVRAGDGPLVLIATGAMVKTALKVSCHWRGTSVWTAPCIKPLDAEAVLQACKGKETVVVLEEHSIYGGLGSAVAEFIAETGAVRVCRVGVQDRFSSYCGSYAYLIKEHGLDADTVVKKIETFMARPIDTPAGNVIGITSDDHLPVRSLANSALSTPDQVVPR
jgi:transketolase